MALRSLVFTFGAQANQSNSAYRANPSVAGQPVATIQTVVLTYDDSVSANRIYKALDGFENRIVMEQSQLNNQPNNLATPI
jgi:hypothetical protein